MEYQHRVAGWVAAHILAEKDAPPAFDLSASASLEWLRCETDEPVDDLLVGTSDRGLIFVQAKRSVQLSQSDSSVFAAVLKQFVDQFLARRGKAPGKQLWDRPLDSASDRLALITTQASSDAIRVRLASVLDRLHGLHDQQELADAAKNKEERRVLSIVLSRVAISWRSALGEEPSDAELRQLLSLVRVYVLDADAGGDAEREALRLLRTTVLSNPDQVTAAWTQLIRLSAGFAQRRSGADRRQLQKALENAEVRLRVAPSYRSDIERLKRYSSTTFSTLAHLSEIRVASTTVKIRRRSTDTLRQAVEEASTLIVGEPGAGKSGALHDLVRSFGEEGRDYVFLAVDRLGSRSAAELRDELGLEHELHQILENWPGTQHALLVIDALDAARGEPAAVMLRDLMRQVIREKIRWHVVASIRKFDLRYGVEVSELFPGSPVTEFEDPEFRTVRHLNVPLLSPDELEQITPQAPRLAGLIRNAPAELQKLLRVPFNLRLVADLLGGGADPQELTPLRTQLELLDRYWFWRVIRSDGRGDAREPVLTKTCELMVQDRSLRVPRSRLADAGQSAALAELLSSQVLVEWQPSAEAPPDRYVLAFSHHVLFDYAVARLVLRGPTHAVVTRVASDPDLTVVVRPSLLLHFRHLWALEDSRQQFWSFTFAMLQADRIPQIGKLIGPLVAAELARTVIDLDPLRTSLNDVNADGYAVAEQALRHLVGALLAGAGSKALGSQAGPWPQLLKSVTENLQPGVAYAVRPLLSSLCDRPDALTVDERNSTGQAARRLLEFAWSRAPRDPWLIINALQCVCRTFESSPNTSAALIRRCLEPSHLSHHGFEEIPWLAREVKYLIGVDPALVREVYSVAFRHVERSQEATEMGTGRILSLRSNRQQDYGGALYALAEAFPTFLERAPGQATQALIAAAEAYVAQHHSSASERAHEDRFDFEGRQVRLLSDYSGIWDEGDTYRHDDAVKMFDAFEDRLATLAARPETSEELRLIVEHLISENRLAVLWRRVLLVAARHPATLGMMILPFASAIPVLTGIDTSTIVGEFLKAIVPVVDAGQRERIERAVISIPNLVPPDHREAGEHIRDRLLGCLQNGEAITEEAKRLLVDLRARNAIPANEPSVRFEGWSRTYGEEEFLKDQGVPVEAEPNQRIRELERPVKEFADKHLNSTPGLDEASSLLAHLRTLHDGLTRADGDGVHPKQRDHAWGCLAAACARIARTEDVSCEEGVGAFAKGVLLEASTHPEPTPDPDTDAGFDEHPSWGSPLPRIEAASGLIVLARGHRCETPALAQALERLMQDPVPAVRYQIVRGLNTLYRKDPELMWRMIEGACLKERSRGVLQGLLSGPLNRLAGADPDRIARLTRAVFGRIIDGPGASRVREVCVGIFTALYIWRGQTDSRDIVLAIAARPSEYRDEASHVLGHLREPLTHGPTEPADPKQDVVRQRAISLFGQLLRSAALGLRAIQSRLASTSLDQWPANEREVAQSLARLVDHAAAEVYFASGAYQERTRARKESEQTFVSDRAARFYREAGAILDDLADVGLASVTHHVLETLEYFIPIDPAGVFGRVGRVVRAGTHGGYQYESLAADLIVRLVERFIADYRSLLRENAECRKTLVEILDVFVDAGWPSARRLTFGLEEIFR